jgi:Leucine-rich repeat (LRR) protein
LEFVNLPDGVREVDILRQHPRVWKIGTVNANLNSLVPADQYWDEFTPAFRPDAESGKLVTKAHAAGVAVGRGPTEDTIYVQGKGLLSVTTGGNNLKRLPDYHELQITWLFCNPSPFEDLSPLAGLPLRGLSMDAEHALVDLGPLAQCKELRYLAVTGGTKVSDLSPLHGLPLTRLVVDNSLVSDLTPLLGLPLRYLSLRGAKISDLSPLAGMTELRDLAVSSTQVADLTPLHKLRLERLIVGNTPINDIAPLAGLPLRVVHLDNTSVRDLRPLLECPDLEEATIPHSATNVEVLRDHPKLKRLSYDYDITYGGPAQTVAEFWKEYDAQKGGTAK